MNNIFKFFIGGLLTIGLYWYYPYSPQSLMYLSELSPLLISIMVIFWEETYKLILYKSMNSMFPVIGFAFIEGLIYCMNSNFSFHIIILRIFVLLAHIAFTNTSLRYGILYGLLVHFIWNFTSLYLIKSISSIIYLVVVTIGFNFLYNEQ